GHGRGLTPNMFETDGARTSYYLSAADIRGHVLTGHGFRTMPAKSALPHRPLEPWPGSDPCHGQEGHASAGEGDFGQAAWAIGVEALRPREGPGEELARNDREQRRQERRRRLRHRQHV